MKFQIFLSLFLVIHLTECLPVSQFYPFGEYVGDKEVSKMDDFSTDEIELKSPFVFYGITYFSYFINVNGILSFLTEIPHFFNAEFPLAYPVIAPFYSDVDLTAVGDIWYRETSDVTIVQTAIADLRLHFDSAANLKASSVSIITYDRVGAYRSRRNKKNTYQVILISDGDDSYVIFNYADGGLQWLQGNGKQSGQPDALGQAGFVSQDGRLYTLRGSGTDQVRNLNRWSNVGQDGVWMFRVGKIETGSNIQAPKVSQDLSYSFESILRPANSCAVGGTACHSTGNCIDHEQGFCCECNEDSFGNGINCIKKDAPIRVTGKLSGNINGFEIEEGDLHAYVLATEGRTYTAVSRIPLEVGFDLQTLTCIGEGIAWLFAVPKEGVPNGFTFTGAIFNRTVEVSFPQSGHKATIRQYFEGLDVFNNVAVTTIVSGSVPTISIGAELEVAAFKEEYTKIQSGQRKARSNRSFKVKDHTIETPYSVETTINFVECDHAPLDQATETLRFKVVENVFIRYDQAESIIRFSFSSKVGNLEEEDPCIKGRENCGANSQCIVDEDNYRCVCEQGYDYVYDTLTNSQICLDLNECDLGLDVCDQNSLCYNSPGSFTCQCKEGYAGDGFYCTVKLTCHNAGCDGNARCEEINERPTCTCNSGYRGDGFFCIPDFGDDSCLVSQNCSPYAICAPIRVNVYTCQCLEGYIGDGYQCRDSHFPAPIIPAYNPFPGPLYPNPTPYEPKYRPDPYPELKPYDPYEHPTIEDNTVEEIMVKSTEAKCVLEICWCPSGYILNKDTRLCDPTQNPIPAENYGIVHFKTCPDGAVFNEIYKRCESFIEVQIADRPLPICRDGVCLCSYGFEYTPETEDCKPLHLPEFDYSIKGGVSPCNVLNNCHPNGQCLYYGDEGKHKCACNAGYTGNGHYCSPIEINCDEVNICHYNAHCLYDDNEMKSVCVCKNGFSGDGLVCTPQDDCSRIEDCDINAQCQYDGNEQRYICACNEEYLGDGFYCTASDIKEEDCSTLQDCDFNADCLYDDFFQCRCRVGYEGDGYICHKIQIGCNILNNCDSNAKCRYDEVAQGFQCKCNEGFSGDGIYCQMNCLRDPSVCHPEATCERSSVDDYSAACICRADFTGDGYNCQRRPDHEKNILLMNQGLSVLRMPINNELSNGFPIHVDPYMTAVGADIDCLTGKYYWTDVGSRAIRSMRYDGTERKPVISGTIGSPEDVAVDWVSQNIYWTDSLNDIVSVSDSKGEKIRTVIKDELVNPRGITVHPGLGLLFWSDWNRENPKIEVSSMDGSGRRILVSGAGVSLPNSLAIDYETTNLCWADAGTHKIECIGVEGYGRKVIIEGIKYPFGLTLHKQIFYYTDWNDTKIHEVNKYTGEEERYREPPLGGSGKLYGIVAVPEHCPPVSNICQIENGGCRSTHLCLPNGRGGRMCACADESKNDLEQCSDYNY